MDNNYKMVAKTLFGMEELLAQELRQLGASDIEMGTRMVSFKGDKGFMYKANLCCRTAIKILKPITAFNVFKEEDLYKHVYAIKWEDYMDVNGLKIARMHQNEDGSFKLYFTNIKAVNNN